MQSIQGETIDEDGFRNTEGGMQLGGRWQLRGFDSTMCQRRMWKTCRVVYM